jgi:hypothetical protein
VGFAAAGAMLGQPGIADRADIDSCRAPPKRPAKYGEDDHSGTTSKSKHPHVQRLEKRA